MPADDPGDPKKLANTRHEAQRAAQARQDVQHAALTISSNHNPKDLLLTGGVTANTSVHQIDGAENVQVGHMKSEAQAKGANGVRTEIDLQRLPSVAGMNDFDKWKASLKPDPKDHKVNDSLGAFEHSSYFHQKDFGNAQVDTINHELTYQEATEDQLRQTKGMKNDIVLGIGNPNKALDTAKRDANGHIVDPGNGPVGDYLKNLGGQARWVANRAAADRSASRLEIGNEPNNDPIQYDKQTKQPIESLGYVNGHKVSDQANEDNYALVEGSLYNAIKSNNDLHGTRVDMAAPMQQPHAQQTMDFLARFNAGGQLVGGMAADQEYYAKQMGWHQHGHELMTDETNMHLYATRKADGKFDTKDADSTLAAYGRLSRLGYLPNRGTITETGVYDDARWQNNQWSEPTAAEARDVATDQYTLLDHEIAKNPFHIDGINTYCYGNDADGRAGKSGSDTARTATGYNQQIGYQGFRKAT